ncbi:hypothetical protein [Williamsoniiplasma lucivorax]|uniref:Uncharacterized protein n=1 Tax=Williamsoniiplasma lucivorax TaxID=209274 RepID=A0A2S5RDW9_9MOLU|nr:hypothetical protein [Williamsoniiplasma lucivorax]PPE05513.1 hypothetical protein ELUCI_v1c06060 [Williamsoniiplasma lucivorax]
MKKIFNGLKNVLLISFLFPLIFKQGHKNFTSIKTMVVFWSEIILAICLNTGIFLYFLKVKSWIWLFSESAKYLSWTNIVFLIISLLIMTILLITCLIYSYLTMNIKACFQIYKIKMLVWKKPKPTKNAFHILFLALLMVIEQFVKTSQINYQIIRNKWFDNFEITNSSPPM